MRPNFSAHVLATNIRGEFLLVKRRDVPVWVIPGGTAEVGESPAQTAAREFREETGISVSSKDLHLAVHYTPQKPGNRAKYSFVVSLTGKQNPTPTSESSEVGFFAAQQLPSPISVYEEERILDAFKRYKGKSLSKTDTVNYLREFGRLSADPIELIQLFTKYVVIKLKSRRPHSNR